jgi:hypothetical protein
MDSSSTQLFFHLKSYVHTRLVYFDRWSVNAKSSVVTCLYFRDIQLQEVIIAVDKDFRKRVREAVTSK